MFCVWDYVPYDCGFVFVRDPTYLRGSFSTSAAYLSLDELPTVWNALDFSAENSRRFRALSVWCALRAAGRAGYREIVERSIHNAALFAAWVEEQPLLELMAPAHLNIVCFRVLSEGDSDAGTDALNSTVIDMIQRGGIAYVTPTRWQGRGAIRAAFDNWATATDDVYALEQAVAEAVAIGRHRAE